MRLTIDLGGSLAEVTERRNAGPYPWLVGTGPMLLAARAGHLDGIGVGETANVRVEIDNARGQASALIGYAPRAPATLYDDAGSVYLTGLAQEIEYGDPLVLTLEAGGGALLESEQLPLRTTRALGDYSADAALPWLFGDLTAAPFPLIRLSETRYFVADHPAEVTKVFIDRQEVFGWATSLETDGTRTWTVVTFAAAIDPDAAVSACGRGLRDADTGELIENPADMLHALYAIAGRDEDFSDLRAECSGLRAATRVSERTAIKVAADRLTQSFGAIAWHGGARLYPAPVDSVLDLYAHEVRNLRVKASASDTADVLRVAYDYSDASQRFLHYIELTSSPTRFGGLAKEVQYASLRTPADAELIGRQVLQRMAGCRSIEFDTTSREVGPGMWVRPVAHPQWTLGADPILMALAASIEADNGSRAVSGEQILGESAITVTAHSIALPDTVEAGVEVSLRDGIATFTITDENGRPLKGARVQFDGGAAKTTDALGKVSFPATPGRHLLAFEAVGFAPLVIEVTL